MSDYRIRESRRAKYVSIKISTWGDVEVVVPPGFDPNELAAILRKRRGWIQTTRQRIQLERQAIAQDTAAARPTLIHLQAVNETWQVHYTPQAHANVTAHIHDNHTIEVTGRVDQIDLCQTVLSQWIRNAARHHLNQGLAATSRDCGLSYNKTTIRRQKTRWASCSSTNNISLNDKLLFLPPELVRYVYIHELCHTIHLNHSAQFWALVQKKEPNYRKFDQELRKAWRYVPRWLEMKGGAT